ncbi:hypothetical protein ACIREE_02530 [Streptomyces sp. NPDC102467]|uniref:hypothetical protein n=1 Tax=Streptomyces sp. NPDC102467 TaxID=3366179 RepID=UPI003821CE1B
MSEHGGAAGEPQQIPRSRLSEYAEMSTAAAADPPATPSPEQEQEPEPQPEPQPDVRDTEPVPPEPVAEDPEAAARKRAFAELLGEFRRTAVLVPLGEEPHGDGEHSMLTADLNGIRFILAFSDEQALARYAQARGEFSREWTYRRVLGAKLLDVAVPAAGVPCGVALDCADGPDGMVFPPVMGIVPDEAAVDHEEGIA